MEWNGVHYPKPFMGTNSKGLGIIWRKGKGQILKYDKDLKYAIPLEYEKKSILAFWPTHDKTNGTYTKIAKSIIDNYSKYFKENEVIITGDFNLYYKPSVKNYAANILSIDKSLNDLGLQSVYHTKKKVSPGFKGCCTYYHQNKEDQVFFLDYTYTNIPIEKIEYNLKDLKRDFSDHVGQVIEC